MNLNLCYHRYQPNLYNILLREPKIYVPAKTTPYKKDAVRSNMTAGSPPDGCNPDFRIPNSKNPEKSRSFLETYQIKALDSLICEGIKKS